jgi:ribosomal protein S15P/S13E
LAVAFEQLAEQKIREAIDAGEFDNLPNAGSPINLEEYFSMPAHLRMAYSVLKSANCLPEEVELMKEIEALESHLADEQKNSDRARMVQQLRDRRLRLAILLERHKKDVRSR